jgi:hypothetical protein
LTTLFLGAPPDVICWLVLFSFSLGDVFVIGRSLLSVNVAVVL